MPTLEVENLQDTFMTGLKVRAAVHGWTLQQEVKTILESAAAQVPVPQPDQGGPALARNAEEGFLDSIDLLERSLEEQGPSPDPAWVLNFLPPGAAAALVQGGPALARNPEEGFLDSIDLLERSLEAGWPSPDQTWALNF
jgi:plasmid stability protein